MAVIRPKAGERRDKPRTLTRSTAAPARGGPARAAAPCMAVIRPKAGERRDKPNTLTRRGEVEEVVADPGEEQERAGSSCHHDSCEDSWVTPGPVTHPPRADAPCRAADAHGSYQEGGILQGHARVGGLVWKKGEGDVEGHGGDTVSYGDEQEGGQCWGRLQLLR